MKEWICKYCEENKEKIEELKEAFEVCDKRLKPSKAIMEYLKAVEEDGRN